MHVTGIGTSVWDGTNKGGGTKGDRLHWRVQGSTSSPTRPESVAGGGWFEVLWNLECPVGLSQKERCAHFKEGNLAQFGQSAEKLRIVELRSEI